MLSRWGEEDPSSLLIGLVELLKHPEPNIHILAYSCLLNQAVLRPKRGPGSLLVSLEQVYLYYRHNHSPAL